VHAAIGPFDGYITTLKPFMTMPDGTPYPSYRCVFPDAPPPGLVANCSEVGVLGSVVGVIGTPQATEVITEITGLGEGLAGRLVLYDARGGRFEPVRVAWDPDNDLRGHVTTILVLSVHEAGVWAVAAVT